MADALMIVGTASSVGKSLLVAAFCRLFAREGLRVAPFKAQNMSLNSFATRDGREIGRAQAMQAQAAGVEPLVEMNPILLKPEGDARSQVVAMGRPWRTLNAGDYYQRRDELWQVVTAAFDTLSAQFDLIIIEGAGAAIEPNFRSSDIVNLRVARYAHAPALLAGDIDRGGVFGALLGTLDLLAPDERALIAGFIINKFRGDRSLLTPALTFLEQRAGLPVVAVVPHLGDLRIADEDSVALEGRSPSGAAQPEIDIAVIHVPHMSNFDDFDALALESGVRVRFVGRLADWGRPDAIILPGSKTTMQDLAWLNHTGLGAVIQAHARRGLPVAGICGGYQMLGRLIRDPERVESDQADVPGLGLLPVETVFEREKTTEQVQATVAAEQGFWQTIHGQAISGYEIHMGRTTGAAPCFRIAQRGGRDWRADDGAVDESGRVFGTYLHGLFDNPNFRRAWLNSLGAHHTTAQSLRDVREREYDRLTDSLRAALDRPALQRILSRAPGLVRPAVRGGRAGLDCHN